MTQFFPSNSARAVISRLHLFDILHLHEGVARLSKWDGRAHRTDPWCNKHEVGTAYEKLHIQIVRAQRSPDVVRHP